METYLNLIEKIIIPVIIPIALAFFSFHIAKQQIINAGVTQFRQQWIEDLRESVSTFIAKAELIAMTDLEDDQNYMEHIQELSESQNRIELMLNPLEDEHNKIVEGLVAIRALIHDSKISDKKLAERLDANTVTLLSATKRVLKSEWLRVKKAQ